MGKLINHHQAKEYLDSIADPVVQALIQQAYGNIFVHELHEGLEGEFDVRFLFRILEALLRDRQQLAQALRGEVTHTFGKDEAAPRADLPVPPVSPLDAQSRT